MPDIDIAALERVALRIFRQNQSLTDVAAEFEMDDMLRAFENMRLNMIKMITEMTPEQVNFNSDPDTYSVSEIFSHIVAAQGNTYNGFLDTGESTRPHIDPVPRNPGGGAEKGRLPTQIIQELQDATAQLVTIARETYKPTITRTVPNPIGSGTMTQKAIMLLQILHDFDHFRQTQTLRRSQGFPKRARRTETLPTVAPAPNPPNRKTQEMPPETGADNAKKQDK